MVDFQSAMAARSLRTVKAELEFLSDCGHITSAQLSTILSNLPLADLGLSATTSAMSNTTITNPRVKTPEPTAPVASHYTAPPPATYNSNNEKANPVETPAYQAAPPAYQHPPTLSVVTALYDYAASDAGDLALKAGETINVTEYVNADWWRGVNVANNQTGIFPKSYVAPAAVKNEKDGYGYGNVPLQVANSGSGPSHGEGEPGQPSKFQEHGKKFGKKLGNAAIFGAGATIGSNIVNGIF
ncbi:Endophilin-A2 [Dactylellina cionopaga]|nr:Endophilin-A2 [Dactylellina cionopaga]